ncbi:MAG TPA: hypothetical protein VHP11_05380 [Tepidisphaeraceae bacterium]|nr:hypothetical protein [Tepidisphaeraceae bacterium]
MGYDCTLHVIDPIRIRSAFCGRLLGRDIPATAFDVHDSAEAMWTQLAAALAEDDVVAAAQTIAQGAICFSAAELPAHYERGFCLSLWSWRMEDDALLAEVPKKYRGSPAELDALFAPLVEAYPRLKGRWPTEMTGNGSVGIFVPAEEVPGLLKWCKRKIASYPRPVRRLFRGLLLVLEECARRGVAYWEACEVTDIRHPIEVPEHMRTPWLKEARLPRKGTWEMVANVALPGHPPLCVFSFMGLENYLTEPRACVVTDLASWPPTWITGDESLWPCDRGRDGRWLVVSQREPDKPNTWHSAPRRVELRDRVESPGAVIDVPMTPAAWDYLQSNNGPNGPAPGSTPVVDFVALIRDLPVLTVPRGRPGSDRVPPFCPQVLRDGKLTEAEELPKSVDPIATQAVIRLADGADVLFWEDKGYELVDGRLKPTFVSWPEGWLVMQGGIAPVGADAILVQAYSNVPRQGALFQSRRNQMPHQVALAVENLSELSAGPAGSVLARQVGRSPKHLGCILWPEQGRGGTVLWIDDDLFPDEDPDNICRLLWSEAAGRLIAVTSERLWAVPIERVLNAPRHNASTGRRLREPSGG